MSFADRLTRGLSTLALRQFLEVLSALVAAVLLIRYFGPAGYGLFALAVSVAELAALASGNFEEAVRRFVPEYRAAGQPRAAQRVVLVALGTRVGLGAAATALLIAGAAAIAVSTRAGTQLTAPIMAAACLIVPIGVNAVATSLLIALERWRELALASVAAAVTALGTAVCAPLLGLDVASFLLLTALVQLGIGVAVLSYAMLGLRSEHMSAADVPWSRTELRRIGRYVWPLWGSAANYTAYQHASRLLLGYFAAPAVVGYFALAKTLVERLMGLYYQLPLALLPSLAQRRASAGAAAADAVVQRLAVWVVPLALFLAIATLCFAPELVLIVGGADFAPAAAMLSIFAGQFLFRLPASLWGTLYYLHERTLPLLWMNLARVLPLLFLLVLLVPRWGGYGAAAAEAASYALSLALFAWHVPGEFGIPARAVLGRVGRAALILTAVAALIVLSGWNPVLRYALAAASPLLIAASGFIRADQLDEMRGIPLSSAPMRVLQGMLVRVVRLGMVGQR